MRRSLVVVLAVAGYDVTLGGEQGTLLWDVRDVTATAEKQAGDDRTLRIAVRENGDVVAEASTDAPHGETVATHHE